jgi:hypothetical protein
MLGGSPPRPMLQPGVHGVGALPQQCAVDPLHSPTNIFHRTPTSFPTSNVGTAREHKLRALLGPLVRAQGAPASHGRAQPARTSREPIYSYSSMAPWNFSSRVLPLSYLKQQAGCPHDCALSLLLSKPTSPAPPWRRVGAGNYSHDASAPAMAETFSGTSSSRWPAVAHGQPRHSPSAPMVGARRALLGRCPPCSMAQA